MAKDTEKSGAVYAPYQEDIIKAAGLTGPASDYVWTKTPFIDKKTNKPLLGPNGQPIEAQVITNRKTGKVERVCWTLNQVNGDGKLVKYGYDFFDTPAEMIKEYKAYLRYLLIVQNDVVPFLAGVALAARAVSEAAPAASGPKAPPSIRERLGEFYKQLGKQQPSKTAEEALQRIRTTMDEVEDALSGIPKKEPPPPPKTPDGRMYPPRDDFVTHNPDGSISARTAGHDIQIGKGGGIKIVNRKSKAVEFEQPGGGQ